MAYKVKIKFADDTEKEFIIGSDVDLPSGMQLDVTQLTGLLSSLNSLTSMMSKEGWKLVRIKLE